MKKFFAVSLAAVLALSMISCGKEDTTRLGDDGALEVEADIRVYDSFQYSVNEAGSYDIVGYLYNGTANKEIVIPAEIDERPVEGIGADAFKAMATLTKVEIPTSVKYIEDFAFWGCTGLTEIVIPDSVTKIGAGVFWECSNLASVKLSSTLTEIGAYAFWCCDALTAISLPATLAEIGDGAFWSCSGLTDVIVPASVTKVGQGAFVGCEKLAKITIEGGDVEIKDKDGKVVDTKAKDFGEHAFLSMDSVEIIVTKDTKTEAALKAVYENVKNPVPAAE